MKNVDYIVVGLGIAGICFAEQLERHSKSFVVIDSAEEGATARSGGIFNPIVLKRFTAAWNAATCYPKAVEYYQELSKKLQKQIFVETPVLRILNNTEEQNNWVVASEKIGLRNHLQTNLEKNFNPHIAAPLGFGKLMGTARIEKSDLISSYKHLLESKNLLVSEIFEYEKLQVQNEGIVYRNIYAKRIVFCDGPGVMYNPFFPKDAIIPNKGEYLVICAPDLKVKEILKGPLFIIPLGSDLYRVGATYSRDDSSPEITPAAKSQIISKLKRMISCSFEVISQTAGIRPTTRDRNPLLGNLAKNPHLVFFNGLGTHGFLMAPYLSEVLFQYLENKTPIPTEMNIQRIFEN